MNFKYSSLVLLSFLLIVACKETVKEEVVVVDKDMKMETLDSLISLSPRDHALYFERAQHLQEIDNIPKALADIYSAIQLDSAIAEYYYLAGDLFIDAGEGQKAIAIMSKGINLIPENEDLYLRAVEYSYYMKHYEGALNFCNDLLEINKYNADAYFLKAMIYEELGDSDKAISTYQTCVEVDPTFYNAYMQLGLIYLERKDDIAIQYFDNAQGLTDNSREALYAKAYHFQNKEDYNEAINRYRDMIEIDPKDHEVFYNIGHCYIGVDSLDKAYKHFDLALKVQPQYAGAYYMKGYVSELAGNKEDAIFNYQQALTMLPGDSTIEEALVRVQ